MARKCLLILIGLSFAAFAEDAFGEGRMPKGSEYTNCVGMKFVRIEPGTFEMGQIETPLPSEVLPSLESGYGGGYFDLLANGDFDERPVHTVKISKPFYMGCFEVTNFQYELFESEHKLLRGKNGFSSGDEEAVIFVNWYQAKAYCDWLSEKEGLPYRLPTEAEWEYACRAGTKTNYYTGDVLTKEYVDVGRNASLKVGQGDPNPWGLYNMHGNVEEWCQDWYGPYAEGAATDPVGYAEGNIRVTRGGSHGTNAYYLRSANRMGTVPEDKHEYIGFRVVIGQMPETKPLPAPPKPLCQQNVIQRSGEEVRKGPDPDKPYFKGPRKHVRIPRDAAGPVFAAHNHNPQIVACPNGDLIVTWCTSVTERRREMTIGGTRL
ncbi:MAG: formylglycine-generating enzyme family protein, partial [Planctomycetota bacterium]